eukprot:TRINITY_DN5997_c0_g1_i2.p1 TRINITY_DN5997_c0_g1~~TRINITY_DN5997_c0_g1_i2.p1  ORF type:complete len:533 (-),score=120.43 TRINITY_DN5997_c0_g1_i2:66-1664(-)
MEGRLDDDVRSPNCTATPLEPKIHEDDWNEREGFPLRDSLSVLLLAASAGTGHMRAAQAIGEEYKRMFPKSHIQVEDVLEYTPAFHRAIYQKGLPATLKHAPHLYGFIYDKQEKVNSPSLPNQNQKSKDGDGVIFRSFRRKVLKSRKWDLVICCHMIPAQIVGSWRAKTGRKFPLVLLITDFSAHSGWIQPEVSQYFVANGESKAYLKSLGISDHLVTVSGLPVDPVFREKKDAQQLKMKHNLDPNLPIVLQLGGGLGLEMEESFHQLLSVSVPVHYVVVTGKNKQVKQILENVLESRKGTHQHKVTILGYCSVMHELYYCADLSVGKPGGMSSSEALVSGVPMLINSPIPGQEERNSDYLLENGVAVKSAIPELLGFKMELLLKNPKKLETMKKNSLEIARPEAAKSIIKRSISLVNPVDAMENASWNSKSNHPKKKKLQLVQLSEEWLEESCNLLCYFYSYHPSFIHLFPLDVEKRLLGIREYFLHSLRNVYSSGTGQVWALKEDSERIKDIAYWYQSFPGEVIGGSNEK